MYSLNSISTGDKVSILGIYSKGDRKRKPPVEALDPTKYHDSSAVLGNAGSLLPSHGYDLRGVVIPRSTRDGASLGNDHENPTIITIDPEFTGGKFKVDIRELKKNKNKLAQVIKKEFSAGHESTSDAIIAAFGAFAIDENKKEETGPVKGQVIEK